MIINYLNNCKEPTTTTTATINIIKVEKTKEIIP